jgi:hypothetical protein
LILEPLVIEDQKVVDLDSFEPEWVVVPFKRPLMILWD